MSRVHQIKRKIWLFYTGINTCFCCS